MTELELLAQYRPWLRTVARNMLSDARSRYIEDLAQEGWIAMWRAHPERYDAPDDFILKQAARRRMNDVLTTIIRGERGGKRGAKPLDTETVLVDDFELLALSVDLPAVELAYHHGEVLEALNSLSPAERRYVYLRFWLGYDWKGINEHFGYRADSLWRPARTKLLERLGHLIPA